jgi:uncharacterized protein (TIGR00156 family)
MKMKFLSLVLCGLLATTASAQFTGPEVASPASTVAKVQTARLGSYVSLSGHIVAHQRESYFTFRDATGELRVEIDNPVWKGRPVAPETKVRLVGEVSQAVAGRYLYVKSLDIAP